MSKLSSIVFGALVSGMASGESPTMPFKAAPILPTTPTPQATPIPPVPFVRPVPADDVAGGVPPRRITIRPRYVPQIPESGMLAQATQKVICVALGMKRAVLVCYVRKGMSRDEVRAILGKERALLPGRTGSAGFYAGGVIVRYAHLDGIGGGPDAEVACVDLSLLFR